MFILNEMKKYNIAILLFSLIFDIVLMIFIVISVLLIYSLLMIGVETKTFETGIMRMVGVSKRGLILMIVLQSAMFVLPAITLGIILCFPALAACYSLVFQEKLKNGFEPVPTWNAVLLAFIVGLFIPFLSSILPLLKVLG
jgi:ABC-type antimicrobial peptide transport system permease subunit